METVTDYLDAVGLPALKAVLELRSGKKVEGYLYKPQPASDSAVRGVSGREGEEVRWVTNIYNPTLPEARSFGPDDMTWEQYNEWVAGFTIGPPQATSRYTVEELKTQNMIGLYTASEEKERTG